VTVSPRASADGGDAGSAVPLPLDWPLGGAGNGFAVGPRALREAAADLRGAAADSKQTSADGKWEWRGSVGSVRNLQAEPGLWASARSFQHVHAQLQEGVTAFYQALVAGLPAVAAKLDQTAGTYERAEAENAAAVDRAGSSAYDGSSPSLVGPDGRF
jgi:uncharacterized protein YukE